MSNELVPDVRRAAESVAKSWDHIVTADDVAQGMWVKLLESRNYVDQVAGMADDRRRRVLYAIGVQVAQREREDYAEFTGNLYYSAADARRILESGRDVDAPGTLSHTERMDLDAGMRRLADAQPAYAEALHAEYSTGTFDGSSGAARKELSRARAALARAMSRAHAEAEADHAGPGSRTAMRNGVHA